MHRVRQPAGKLTILRDKGVAVTSARMTCHRVIAHLASIDDQRHGIQLARPQAVGRRRDARMHTWQREQQEWNRVIRR
jgi:hypothetical protein